MGRRHPTEIAREAHLLSVGERLIAKDQHLVLKQGLADGLHRSGVEFGAEIDAADLGAGERGERLDGEAGLGSWPVENV
jgi:hypothetical protein